MRHRATQPPRVCPTCGANLSDHPYAQIRPAKGAKALRRLGLWLLPVLAMTYLAQLFLGGTWLGVGTGAGYYAVLWIGGPSLVLYMVSRLLPRVRQVICLRCSWNEEYPLSRTAGRVV